jgi:hypothetical protein
VRARKEQKQKSPMERLAGVFKTVNDRYFGGKLNGSYEVKIPRGEAAVFSAPSASSNGRMVGTGVPASEWDFPSRTAHFHPILFHMDAPVYVLVYLMYHEFTHGELPPGPGQDVHHDEFMVREEIAPHRNASTKWLRAKGFPTLAIDGQ